MAVRTAAWTMVDRGHLSIEAVTVSGKPMGLDCHSKSLRVPAKRCTVGVLGYNSIGLTNLGFPKKTPYVISPQALHHP
jgi:hypothetical protein